MMDDTTSRPVEETVQQGVSMVDLHESLSGPDGDMVRAQIGQRLGELRDAIVAKREEGLPAGQFEASDTVLGALYAAANLVR